MLAHNYFLFMVASAQLQTGENIAVTNTDAGKVRGYIHNSIYTYKGIPYAEANGLKRHKNLNRGQVYAVQ
jgi:hypothetical protein